MEEIENNGKNRKGWKIRDRGLAWSMTQPWGGCNPSSNLGGPILSHFSFTDFFK